MWARSSKTLSSSQACSFITWLSIMMSWGWWFVKKPNCKWQHTNKHSVQPLGKQWLVSKNEWCQCSPILFLCSWPENFLKPSLKKKVVFLSDSRCLSFMLFYFLTSITLIPFRNQYTSCLMWFHVAQKSDWFHDTGKILHWAAFSSLSSDPKHNKITNPHRNCCMQHRSTE